MSQVCAVEHLVPHRRSSNLRGVAMPSSRSRIRCSATTGTNFKPHAAVVDKKPGDAQRAAVLAIGTANPANCIPQDEYADWYFRVTKAEHLARLKAKMKKICSNSRIKKRYFHHTDDTFQDYPELIDRSLPSLDTRQAILASAVPELAAAAAAKAITEWGRPASDVTHLVLATYSGVHMPGADVRLASLLGLRRTAQRTMAYFGGCAAGSAALRLAKDVAENNPGARVLVVCAELSLVLFRAPESDKSVDTVVKQALFGDGAAAVIVGAGEDNNVIPAGNIQERPIFEMVSASQATIPDSEDAAGGHLREDGFALRFTPKLPALVRQHVERCLADAVAPLGIGGRWNDLFWAVHPGGPKILDGVEAELALAPEKLAASRHVLAEYGNLSGASIIFVLDELRRRREVLEDGGLGVMLGLGPGVSVETMVLRAVGGEEKRQ